MAVLTVHRLLTMVALLTKLSNLFLEYRGDSGAFVDEQTQQLVQVLPQKQWLENQPLLELVLVEMQVNYKIVICD